MRTYDAHVTRILMKRVSPSPEAPVLIFRGSGHKIKRGSVQVQSDARSSVLGSFSL